MIEEPIGTQPLTLDQARAQNADVFFASRKQMCRTRRTHAIDIQGVIAFLTIHFQQRCSLPPTASTDGTWSGAREVDFPMRRRLSRSTGQVVLAP